MMRLSLLACAAFALTTAACQTTGPNGGKLVAIETDPPGATVTVGGYGECETPCTVEVSGPQPATIAKAGFKKQDVTLSPDERRLRVTLEFAAPTEDVDATALPDL